MYIHIYQATSYNCVCFPLQANYGSHDPACVQRVKDLYRELNLEQVFREYEEKSYQRIVGLIDTGTGSLPRGLFLEFLNKIYKRIS